MKLLSLINPSHLVCVRYTLLAITLAFASNAQASTATYVMPNDLTESEVTALSTAGDSSGVFLGQSQTLALVFHTPFATQNGQNFSIFTVPPSTGRVQFRISFGIYNGGAPTFAWSGNFNAGGTFSADNLFDRGCSAFGGCDYIEITTRRTNRGATGAEVDYVSVEGEVTEVTSPTPEPSTWALMISGFALIGWRLKAMRRGRSVRQDKAGWRYATAEMTPR